MTLSSSKLELLDRCEGAFTLPWRDEPNVHSEAGNERHAADEDAISAGNVPDEYLERWPGLTWRAETSYMYDVSSDTARFLGAGIKRAYGPQGPFEVPGTIDVEGRGNGMLVVIDRKGFEEQAPAARHPQLTFLALAAARAQPAERIVIGIRPEIGAMDVAEIDPMFDLDLIAYENKQRVIRAAKVRGEARAGRVPEFRTGRWCRWCPAFNECPKQSELRALTLLDDDHPELALATFVDDAAAADVFDLWKRIGILHKRIGQQIFAHAANHPIRLHSGKMFGPHAKLGNEKLDGDVVYATVKSTYGQELADAAVARVATKTKLESALKGKRGAMKSVLDAVRAAGGATRTAGTTIEEYEAGPQLVTDGESPF